MTFKCVFNQAALVPTKTSTCKPRNRSMMKCYASEKKWMPSEPSVFQSTGDLRSGGLDSANGKYRIEQRQTRNLVSHDNKDLLEKAYAVTFDLKPQTEHFPRRNLMTSSKGSRNLKQTPKAQTTAFWQETKKDKNLLSQQQANSQSSLYPCLSVKRNVSTALLKVRAQRRI